MKTLLLMSGKTSMNPILYLFDWCYNAFC